MSVVDDGNPPAWDPEVQDVGDTVRAAGGVAVRYIDDIGVPQIYESAPRITEADRTGDKTTPHRRLAGRLPFHDRRRSRQPSASLLRARSTSSAAAVAARASSYATAAASGDIGSERIISRRQKSMCARMPS